MSIFPNLHILGDVAISPGVFVPASMGILMISLIAYARAGLHGHQCARLMLLKSPVRQVLLYQVPSLCNAVVRLYADLPRNDHGHFRYQYVEICRKLGLVA